MRCYKCGTDKPPTDFHRRGDGYQKWCRACHNAYQRETRNRRETPPIRRRNNLKARYGLSESDHAALLSAQLGVCAICLKPPARPVVDHNHGTSAVRGILCHGCNIKLPAIENETFRQSAILYLEKFSR